MANKDDLGAFVFDLYITGAGPSWGEPFRMAAEQEFAAPGLVSLPESTRAWGIAALMVRTGLHLCERRDPGLYHEFLLGVLAALGQERDLLASNGRAGEAWRIPWELFTPEHEMMAMAEGILEKRIVDEPRAVAYALVREGLRFCEDFSPERYCGFLDKVFAFMLEEAERVEGGPRRILPRLAPQVRQDLRVLPTLFNSCAAPPPPQG